MAVNNGYNAAKAEVTIFAPDGSPHKCSKLNANDLTRSQGYTWKPKANTTPEPEAQAPDTPVEPEATPESAEDSFDADAESLFDAAVRLAGTEDVIKYLEGFSEPQLQQMAEARYGEKLHGRMRKEKMIEKIVAFEEEKLASAAE